MRVKAVYQSVLLMSTSLAFNSMAFAEDADLKRMVQEALNAKDKTIAEMDKRLQKLEALTKQQQQVISQLQQNKPQPDAGEPVVVPPEAPPVVPVITFKAEEINTYAPSKKSSLS